MSNPNGPETEPDKIPQQEDAAPEQTAEEPEKDLAAEVEKWKALSRKNEEAAKKNAEAAKLWAEHQEASKTEDQKRAEAEAAAKDRLAALEIENALLKVTNRFNLSEDALTLLNGFPADQVEERAEQLAKLLDSSTRRPSPTAGIGQENPPASSGDFLREAFNRTRK